MMTTGYPYGANPMALQTPQNQGYNPYLQMQQLQQQQVAPPVQQPQTPALNGKFVDSADIVRVTEVPFGGYGVFPKADLSEIYIKSWNPNGTTNIVSYKPILTETPTVTIDINTQILEKVSNLENKLNSIFNISQQPQTPSSPQPETKEVTANAF